MIDYNFMTAVMTNLELEREMREAQEDALRQERAWQIQRMVATFALGVAVILAFLAESL